MIPIISDLISNTVGKVVGKLTDHFLPASMSEEEKAKFKLEAEKLLLEENKLFAEQLSAQMETINATMREESKADHWIVYSWRPLCGYTFCSTIIYNYIIAPIFGIQLIQIPSEVWTSLLVILGASAATRGWEKVKRLETK